MFLNCFICGLKKRQLSVEMTKMLKKNVML